MSALIMIPYYLVAAATILAYDILLTLDEEVCQIYCYVSQIDMCCYLIGCTSLAIGNISRENSIPLRAHI